MVGRSSTMATNGIPLGLVDLDTDQMVALNMFPLTGKCVVAQTTHEIVFETLRLQEQDLQLGGRAPLQAAYRSAFSLVIDFDDDDNWRQQACTCPAKRAAALYAWEEFVADCILLQTLRYSLHGKPIELILGEPRCPYAGAPLQGGPDLTVKPKLQAAIDSGKVLGEPTVHPNQARSCSILTTAGSIPLAPAGSARPPCSGGSLTENSCYKKDGVSCPPEVVSGTSVCVLTGAGAPTVASGGLCAPTGAGAPIVAGGGLCALTGAGASAVAGARV